MTVQVISYGIPIALHLFQRKTLNLKYGPWKLGRWGRLANVSGLIIYVFIFVAVSLPTEVPVTAKNMYAPFDASKAECKTDLSRNYAAPIAGIILLLATVLYVIWGRRTYLGPLFFLTGVNAIVGGSQTPPRKEG